MLGYARSFSIPTLNALESFVFESCSGQTDKQTDGLEQPTYTDQLCRCGQLHSAHHDEAVGHW